MRSVAVFAAVITLAGQLAAASHIHHSDDPSGVNSVAQLSAEGGLCALCLLAFHTSAAPSAPVIAGLPHEYRDAPIIRRTERWTRAAIDTQFGRAPPASL